MDAMYAIAEPRRRRIVELVAAGGRLTATEIANNFDVTPQAVSQHLRILIDAGVLKMERQSQQHIYQVNPWAIEEMERWLEHTRMLWNKRLDVLDGLMKAEKKKSAKKRV